MPDRQPRRPSQRAALVSALVLLTVGTLAGCSSNNVSKEEDARVSVYFACSSYSLLRHSTDSTLGSTINELAKQAEGVRLAATKDSQWVSLASSFENLRRATDLPQAPAQVGQAINEVDQGCSEVLRSPGPLPT